MSKLGMTLMEIIVVLVLVGIAAVFCMPNFVQPTEKARSSGAQNNLLAIATAQQNYNNNFGNFCLASTPAQSACSSISVNCGTNILALDCNLALTIPNDVLYQYACSNDPLGSGFACMATRLNSASNLILTITNAPVQLVRTNPSPNPTCAYAAGYSTWCP